MRPNDRSNDPPSSSDPRPLGDAQLDDLLDRYIVGRATVGEREQLERALAQRPWDATLANGWDALRDRATTMFDVQSARARIGRRLGQYPGEQPGRDDVRHLPRTERRPQYAHRATQRWMFWGVAAAAAIVAGLALFDRHGDQRTVGGATRVYATHIGQRATITLADGSRAMLAPMTTLRMHGSTAELDGEAYFTIAHTSAEPFTVRTGEVLTRVLGTTFDVRRYRGDRETIVAVTSGKVAVTKYRTVTLTGGSVGLVGDSTITVSRDDAIQRTAWTNGQLVFRDTPLSQLLTTVGRWYGVQFRVADSTLARQRITATVDFGSRTELLRALTLVLDVTATFEHGSDSVILIRARRAAAPPAPQRTRNTLFQNPKEIGR